MNNRTTQTDLLPRLWPTTLALSAAAWLTVACASTSPRADGGEDERADGGGRPLADGGPIDTGTDGGDAGGGPDGVDGDPTDADDDSSDDAVDDLRDARPDTEAADTDTPEADDDTEDTHTDTALADTDTEDTNTEDTNTEDTNTEDTNTEDTNTEDTNTDTPDGDDGVDDVAPAECDTGSSEPCYGGPGEIAGVGVCTRGSRSCTDGRWSACTGWTAPTAEQCDDTLDNDCDGAVNDGCAAACPSLTGVISNLDNADIHAVFEDAGYTVSEPFSINASHFSGTSVVLADALYTSSSVTPDVITAFVGRGGTVVFLTTSLSTTCARIQADNLAGLGVGLVCGTTATGPVTRLLDHPLTAGLAAGQFPSSFASVVTGGTPIAQVGSQAVATTLESGCGRLLLVGQGDLGDNAYWPTTEAFWNNAARWLTER